MFHTHKNIKLLNHLLFSGTTAIAIATADISLEQKIVAESKKNTFLFSYLFVRLCKYTCERAECISFRLKN